MLFLDQGAHGRNSACEATSKRVGFHAARATSIYRKAHLPAVQCPAPLLVDILAMATLNSSNAASFHRSGGAVQIQSLDIHAELLLG